MAEEAPAASAAAAAAATAAPVPGADAPRVLETDGPFVSDIPASLAESGDSTQSSQTVAGPLGTSHHGSPEPEFDRASLHTVPSSSPPDETRLDLASPQIQHNVMHHLVHPEVSAIMPLSISRADIQNVEDILPPHLRTAEVLTDVLDVFDADADHSPSNAVMVSPTAPNLVRRHANAAMLRRAMTTTTPTSARVVTIQDDARSHHELTVDTPHHAASTHSHPHHRPLRLLPMSKHQVASMASSASSASLPRSDTGAGSLVSPVARRRTLTHPRPPSLASHNDVMDILREDSTESWFQPWTWYVWALTFWIPTLLMVKCGGMKDPQIQRAWREKVALCLTIAAAMGGVGMVTYGLEAIVCPPDARVHIPHQTVASYAKANEGVFRIHGNMYDLRKVLYHHAAIPGFKEDLLTAMTSSYGSDISALFPIPTTACDRALSGSYKITCSTSRMAANYCHRWSEVEPLLRPMRIGAVSYTWDDVAQSSSLLVISNRVVDIQPYRDLNTTLLGAWVDTTINRHVGTDASYSLSGTRARTDAAHCMQAIWTVGQIDRETYGCMFSEIIIWVSIIVILGVLLVRFFLAVYFQWFLGWQLGKLQQNRQLVRPRRRREILSGIGMPYPNMWPTVGAPAIADDGTTTDATAETSMLAHASANASSNSANTTALSSDTSGTTATAQTGGSSQTATASTTSGPAPPTFIGTVPHSTPGLVAMGKGMMRANSTATTRSRRLQRGGTVHSAIVPGQIGASSYTDERHVIMAVTAYSEGEAALRPTLDSLATTSFADDYKLLFIIADGMVTGSGETRSTPEILLSMIELDENWSSAPIPMPYLAVAEGAARENMAKVYVGWYSAGEHSVPTIVVVKCGTPVEARDSAKPGNRGKRDSQLILMNWLSGIVSNKELCPLEYDLCQKVQYLLGVTPDKLEFVLAVDADTAVDPDSLPRMVASMVLDPAVIGLCGETRIANKRESWVTAIQVFEYYLSQNLSKAFESVFGNVTCLPGCFCMWRIYARREDGAAIPILCHPDIVSTYARTRVNTLHKKNLFMLGEDRFLTTLLLSTFPRRKLIYVPRAFCETHVPSELRVLMSQRRRWINSTFHNLMELLLVRNLCGTFCFSMQGVILLELISTAVLPAAIAFFILLVVMSITGAVVPVLPIIMLAGVLGLPAFLIVLTTRQRAYLGWMVIYLMSIPVWNMLLPLYAFWHFDDFTWGSTRKLQSDADGAHGAAAEAHAALGAASTDDLDAATQAAEKRVRFRRYHAWELERRELVLDALLRSRQVQNKMDGGVGVARPIETSGQEAAGAAVVTAQEPPARGSLDSSTASDATC